MCRVVFFNTSVQQQSSKLTLICSNLSSLYHDFHLVATVGDNQCYITITVLQTREKSVPMLNHSVLTSPNILHCPKPTSSATIIHTIRSMVAYAKHNCTHCKKQSLPTFTFTHYYHHPPLLKALRRHAENSIAEMAAQAQQKQA